MCDLDDKQHVAEALGDPFTRLDQPRYAAMCAAPTTTEILAAYAHDGEATGLKAYRAALAATGYVPPDIPDLIDWGSVMGTEEASAYRSASVVLEHAINAGELTPGKAGWRKTAQRITTRFLHGPRDEVTGATCCLNLPARHPLTRSRRRCRRLSGGW